MDPKQLAQLDPKLREAYDRVMGTNASQAQKTEPSQQAQPEPQQPQAPTQHPKAEPEVKQEQPQPVAVSAPQPSNEPQPYNPSSQAPTPTPSQPPSIGASMTFNAHKKTGKVGGKSMLSGVIIGLGVVIFLVLYTFIWVKVFNLSLPFLS